MEKFDAGHAKQAPNPPAPKSGVPSGDVPPLPLPDIPVPDPEPPPIENPGDAPLPPFTDPDVVEPGEPNPAHTPMRVRGAMRSPEGPAASSSALKADADTRNERVRSRKSAFAPRHESQDLRGSKGVTEREVADIEERAEPRTPVIYEVVRRTRRRGNGSADRLALVVGGRGGPFDQLLTFGSGRPLCAPAGCDLASACYRLRVFGRFPDGRSLTPAAFH